MEESCRSAVMGQTAVNPRGGSVRAPDRNGDFANRGIHQWSCGVQALASPVVCGVGACLRCDCGALRCRFCSACARLRAVAGIGGALRFDCGALRLCGLCAPPGRRRHRCPCLVRCVCGALRFVRPVRASGPSPASAAHCGVFAARFVFVRPVRASGPTPAAACVAGRRRLWCARARGSSLSSCLARPPPAASPPAVRRVRRARPTHGRRRLQRRLRPSCSCRCPVAAGRPAQPPR